VEKRRGGNPAIRRSRFEVEDLALDFLPTAIEGSIEPLPRFSDAKSSRLSANGRWTL